MRNQRKYGFFVNLTVPRLYRGLSFLYREEAPRQHLGLFCYFGLGTAGLTLPISTYLSIFDLLNCESLEFACKLCNGVAFVHILHIGFGIILISRHGQPLVFDSRLGMCWTLKSLESEHLENLKSCATTNAREWHTKLFSNVWK